MDTLAEWDVEMTEDDSTNTLPLECYQQPKRIKRGPLECQHCQARIDDGTTCESCLAKVAERVRAGLEPARDAGDSIAVTETAVLA